MTVINVGDSRRTVVTVGGSQKSPVIVAPDDHVTVNAPTGRPGPPGHDGEDGEKGETGPQGPPGDSSFTTSFVHHQATAEAVWTITHPLEYYPAVTIVDSSGSEVEGDVHYNNASTVTVSFSGAFAGTAYLS